MELSEAVKKDLEKQHRTERDQRIADRIKAVLLNTEGWRNKQIAQALRITAETVAQDLFDYQTEKKLKPANGGSVSKLDEQMSQSLVDHLEANTYLHVKDIVSYVQKQYEVSFTVAGMRAWLKHHDFTYKKPKFIELAAEVFFNKLSAIEAKIDRELSSNTNTEKAFIDIVKTYKSCSRYYGRQLFS